MNRIKLITILLTILSISSCSKEDEREPEILIQENPLKGVWIETLVLFDGIEVNDPSNCDEQDEMYTFSLDGTVIEREYNDFCEERFESGTYNYENNVLTMVLDGDTEIYDVIELTAEKLRFTDMDGNVLIEQTYIKQ